MKREEDDKEREPQSRLSPLPQTLALRPSSTVSHCHTNHPNRPSSLPFS